MAQPNRKQRREAAKKRPGETYADVLARKKQIKEAVEKIVRDESVVLETDIKTQRVLWMAKVALSEEFGFAESRVQRFMLAIDKIREEVEELAAENGWDYAIEKLRQRSEQVSGAKEEYIHEEDMIRARRENEAQGIFFQEDDPEALAKIGFTGGTAYG